MSNNASWDEADTGEQNTMPKGRHSIFIDKLELKLSQANKKYINITWRIESERFNNFCIFQKIFASSDYLNHKNQQWVQQQINMIKRIFMISGVNVPQGMPTPTELQTLVNCHFDAELGVEKQDGYDDAAKILDVFPSTMEFEQQDPDRQSQIQEQTQQEYIPVNNENPSAMMDDEFDDDIPF